MKMLLFGRTGQVGAALVPLLSSLGDLTSLGREGADGLAGDLGNPGDVADTVRRVAPSVVVNAAAYTAVDRAEEERELAYRINAEAPSALADACHKVGALLVHYSTDYVFNGEGERAWREDDPVDPINEYGRTKLAGEEAIRDSGCCHLIFRTSWVYAPHGHNFLNTILRLASERDSLNVVNDQWGVPTHARLVARATGRMLEFVRVDPSVSGTYHVAPAGETTWYRYARHAIETARDLGWPMRVEAEDIRPVGSTSFPTPAKRPQNSRLDCGKLERTLDERMPDWRQGVDSAVAVIVGNRNEELGS